MWFLWSLNYIRLYMHAKMTHLQTPNTTVPFNWQTSYRDFKFYISAFTYYDIMVLFLICWCAVERANIQSWFQILSLDFYIMILWSVDVVLVTGLIPLGNTSLTKSKPSDSAKLFLKLVGLGRGKIRLDLGQFLYESVRIFSTVGLGELFGAFAFFPPSDC